MAIRWRSGGSGWRRHAWRSPAATVRPPCGLPTRWAARLAGRLRRHACCGADALAQPGQAGRRRSVLTRDAPGCSGERSAALGLRTLVSLAHVLRRQRRSAEARAVAADAQRQAVELARTMPDTPVAELDGRSLRVNFLEGFRRATAAGGRRLRCRLPNMSTRGSRRASVRWPCWWRKAAATRKSPPHWSSASGRRRRTSPISCTNSTARRERR